MAKSKTLRKASRFLESPLLTPGKCKMHIKKGNVPMVCHLEQQLVIFLKSEKSKHWICIYSNVQYSYFGSMGWVK